MERFLNWIQYKWVLLDQYLRRLSSVWGTLHIYMLEWILPWRFIIVHCWIHWESIKVISIWNIKNNSKMSLNLFRMQPQVLHQVCGKPSKSTNMQLPEWLFWRLCIPFVPCFSKPTRFSGWTSLAFLREWKVELTNSLQSEVCGGTPGSSSLAWFQLYAD
jgi:hypothetical protein